MSSLAGTVYGFLAACSFNADAAAAAFFVQRGFANPGFVRNGVGDYTLTLQDGAALATETTIQMTLNNVAGAYGNIEVLTTTTMRVRTFVNAAGVSTATDIDFWLQVQKIAP